MSEFKALTLAGAAVVLVTAAVCGALMILGANGYLVGVAMMVVMGIGVDQLSRLGMSFDDPDRGKR